MLTAMRHSQIPAGSTVPIAPVHKLDVRLRERRERLGGHGTSIPVYYIHRFEWPLAVFRR